MIIKQIKLKNRTAAYSLTSTKASVLLHQTDVMEGNVPVFRIMKEPLSEHFTQI